MLSPDSFKINIHDISRGGIIIIIKIRYTHIQIGEFVLWEKHNVEVIVGKNLIRLIILVL